MWGRRVPKREVQGIDGILFYGPLNKKRFDPNKRDSDLDLQLDAAMLKGL